VNLAVKGTAFANSKTGRHIVYTTTEHPTVVQSIDCLEQEGFTKTKVSVGAEGQVDPEAIRGALREDTILICVHHANHDIGTIAPIETIGAIAQDRGIPLFVDAVASAGWLQIDVQKMGASLLAISARRFGGPAGVGVLYRHRRARIAPLIHGGNQEGGRRAGAENVPAIVGAGAASEFVRSTLPLRADHTGRLTAALWDALHTAIPRVRLNGPPPGIERLPNNLNFSIEGAEGEGMALALDMKGFAVASGSSCLGKSLKIPPVLEAINCPTAFALGNIILTLDATNTQEECESFVQALPVIIERMRV
jgi:cysteine desulfurase